MLPVESKWLHPYPVANHGNHTNQERDPTPLLEEARAPSRQHSLPLSVAVPKAMMAVIVIQALLVLGMNLGRSPGPRSVD